ncbi:hypothetical protein PMIN01_12104 [Paraphaeosphaeria minitans]|uniref:Uncharacterized protein n=1 Tax=Paraphaeosphaeria minitans TaxID=565426 RepID=A0A9P6G7R9_9PLEO|nr:hypothetical protein PMIN01_12104 [Paraphaeosphaeria minitans]
MCHRRCTSTFPPHEAECAGSVRSTVRLALSPLAPIEEVPGDAEYIRNVQALAAGRSNTGQSLSFVAVASSRLAGVTTGVNIAMANTSTT